jgi:opacity protein-like surface antigen
MKSAAGGRIFAGARVLEWLSLEADYASLGEIETFYRSTSVHGAGFGFGETTTRMKADALGVSAVAHVSLTQALSIRGRAGVARTRLRSEGERCGFSFVGLPQPSPSGCIGIESSDVAQASPIVGVGLDARLSDRWTLTAGWDRYFGLGRKFDPLTNDAPGEFDIDRYAVGVSWRF